MAAVDVNALPALASRRGSLPMTPGILLPGILSKEGCLMLLSAGSVVLQPKTIGCSSPKSVSIHVERTCKVLEPMRNGPCEACGGSSQREAQQHVPWALGGSCPAQTAGVELHDASRVVMQRRCQALSSCRSSCCRCWPGGPTVDLCGGGLPGLRWVQRAVRPGAA